MSWDGDTTRDDDGKIDNSVLMPTYDELVEARKLNPLEMRWKIEQHMAEVEAWKREHGFGDGR